jgi:hypothetical protein
MRLSEPDPDDNADIGTDDPERVGTYSGDAYRLTDDEREQLQLDAEAEQDRKDLGREARRLP